MKPGYPAQLHLENYENEYNNLTSLSRFFSLNIALMALSRNNLIRRCLEYSTQNEMHPYSER